MAESLQIKEMRVQHVQILDWFIANPGGKKGECAQAFGISRSHLSVILNSDVFKLALKERQENMSSLIDVTISDRITAVSELALEEMERRLEEEPQMHSMKELRETAEMTLDALGYGSDKGGPGGGGTNVVILTGAQQALLEKVENNPINGTAVRVTEGQPAALGQADGEAGAAESRDSVRAESKDLA